MKEYYLELVGLRTVLRTPGKITVAPRLRPFLCESHETTDCTVTVQPCTALPEFSENGIWHGAEFYDRCADTMRTFHCSAPGAAAFAVTQLLPDGNIEIHVMQEYLSYFEGTSGIFNRIGMETLLLQHQGLLLHASLIEYGGKAIAFAGPSGVGKSTQADLWHKCLNGQILNGDRAALRKTADHWQAFGSPYAGTSGIYRNENAPLAALVVLRRGTENRLENLSAAQALRYIYPELSIHHWDKEFAATATDLCLDLLKNTPVYLLQCLPEESAVQLLKKGLNL